MAKIDLSDTDVACMAALANILIAGTGTMPSPAAIEGYNDLLRRAVAACGHPSPDIRAGIDAIPAQLDWVSAEAFARDKPEHFAIVSQMASAAYYMAPVVLDLLGFPTDRRHPAEVEEFVEEYETGIFDRVMSSAPRYRDVDEGLAQQGLVHE